MRRRCDFVRPAFIVCPIDASAEASRENPHASAETAPTRRERGLRDKLRRQTAAVGWAAPMPWKTSAASTLPSRLKRKFSETRLASPLTCET
jgi:hypothetical protein